MIRFFSIKCAIRSGITSARLSHPSVLRLFAGRAGQKLRRLMEAKWKSLDGDPAAKFKLLKYALSRGYDYGQVRSLVEEICRQASADGPRL